MRPLARLFRTSSRSTTAVERPRAATPRWAKWTLFGLLSASAALYSWNLNASGFSDYYATAAKSMSLSWRAFFSGAFDPSATITLDKLSGFLIPQALSVKVFGYAPWALALPQVFEGLITIAAVFWVANRWLGPVGGLVSAFLVAYTPLLISIFSHPMEDALLTMFTALSVVAWQRALETDRMRWLVLAGVLVGFGFQAKMMQAWLVLPAFALVYLLASPQSRGRKVLRLSVAAVVTLAVSISWMTIFNAFPVSSRPYVDGSTDNNIFSMVFGYNGLNHFIPGLVPGALAPDSPTASAGSPATPLLLRIVAHTPAKLFFPEYATQVGWLYPVAIAGIVLGIVEVRRRRRENRMPRELQVALQFSVVLLITVVGVLSAISLPHTAYLASLALPLAILCAIAGILSWRAFRTANSVWRFSLPATVAAETVWTVWLVASYPAFARWMIPPILTVGLVSASVLFAIASGSLRSRRVVALVGVVSAGLAVAAPLIWSLSTLDPAFAGSANDAYAGPVGASLFNPPVKRAQAYGTGLNSNRVATNTANVEDIAYDYAAKRSGRVEYVLATDAWRSAAPMIMDEASQVLPIGGFTSRAPSPTSVTIANLVRRGALRFILLTGPDAKSSAATPDVAAIQDWTRANCSLVPQRTLGVGSPRARSRLPDSLYDCGRSQPPYPQPQGQRSIKMKGGDRWEISQTRLFTVAE
jgi:4-amino-4-deoxy-L-arabinose transferase-like glycosyltransferase